MGQDIKMQNNKRIAKNSLMLYIRMVLLMAVSLFTSRVYLQTLGETDFGIFNIVGGVVILFSFVGNTMQLATQRYLNYALGKEDEHGARKIFNISLLLYGAVSLVIIFFAETIGLWFLNTKMNIPQERMTAANWVYQFALAGFVFQMLRTPYNAVIIAYENMSVYAYFSIIEAILKLGAAISLLLIGYDKLLVLSGITMLVYLAVTVIYNIYCNRKYPISHFQFVWDSEIVKGLYSFSGWSMFGALANLGGSQGVNIILNVFWGVVVNAALGIANQLAAAVNQLVSNFQVAYNPQLVKLYASGDMNAFYKMIFRSSKYSFFLFLYAFIPVCFCAEFILKTWLGSVPAYTVEFSRLIMAFYLVDAISAPLWLSVQAVGKIRNYQLLMSILIFSNLPIIYLLMYFGFSPLYAWVVRLMINILTYMVRVFYLKKLFAFPSWAYIRTILLRICLVLSASVIAPCLLYGVWGEGWINLIVITIGSLLSTTLVIILLGLEKPEKVMLLNFVKKYA